MDVVQAPARGQAAEVLSRWVESFAAALASGDAAQVAGQFAVDGCWRDILALQWSYRTFGGRAQIEAALRETPAPARPRDFRLAGDRLPPRLVRRGGRDVIEGFVDFTAAAGNGTAFIRLLTGETPAAWMLLTTLQELRGYEEAVGARRPSGVEYSCRRQLARPAAPGAELRPARPRGPDRGGRAGRAVARRPAGPDRRRRARRGA